MHIIEQACGGGTDRKFLHIVHNKTQHCLYKTCGALSAQVRNLILNLSQG